LLEENEACNNNSGVDAFQGMPSSNVFEENDFCITVGI